MAENSAIYDSVFTPWREVNGNRVVLTERAWKKPKGQRVLVAADVFEDWKGPMLDPRGSRLMELYRPSGTWVTDSGGHVDQVWVTMQDVRARLFRLIDATPNLDWQILTKRPENIRKMMPQIQPIGNLDPIASAPYDSALRTTRSNLWLGTSPCDQKTADESIPHLLQCRDLCRVLFLSLEPLLGPVDLNCWFWDATGNCIPFRTPCIDWVIVGGESGPNARPMNIAWARSIVEQCKAASVPVFVKQLGSKPLVTYRELCDLKPNVPAVDCNPDTLVALPLKDKKGGDMAEFPIDLQVREYPKTVR